MVKVKFIRDYHPRKKGEVVELEQKLADYYINNAVAVLDGVKKAPKESGCSECEEKAKKAANALEAKITELQEDLDAANAKIAELETAKK